MQEHLYQVGASEIVHLVARREVRVAEVIDAHLQRIEQVNPKLNAVVRVLADEARAAAAAADASVMRDERLGPLHGVPFTVKENIDVAGLPTTCGVRALAQAVAPADAPVVERMRAAGAILVGRTNLPDMALRMCTDSSLHGLTRNPWDHGIVPGGSSGGDAVAVASGMAAIGLGNDVGGSLRNPANACGIVGIRPSRGRVPHAGAIPAESQLLSLQLMMVQGVLARSTADAKLALAGVAGAHPKDPWSLDVPLEASVSLTALPCVAVLAHPPGGACHPSIQSAVRLAAARLERAGYPVMEACPPLYHEACTVWAKLLAADLSVVLARMLPTMGLNAQHVLKAFVEDSQPPRDLAGFAFLMIQRMEVAMAWSRFMEKHPLVLSPVWTQLPFAHGFDVDSPENARAVQELARPVLPANLLGLPSVSVPVALDSETGLPMGVLVTGRHLGDIQCLAAAAVIQQESGVDTPLDPRW